MLNGGNIHFMPFELLTNFISLYPSISLIFAMLFRAWNWIATKIQSGTLVPSVGSKFWVIENRKVVLKMNILNGSQSYKLRETI